jgi:hypothetical protein
MCVMSVRDQARFRQTLECDALLPILKLVLDWHTRVEPAFIGVLVHHSGWPGDACLRKICRSSRALAGLCTNRLHNTTPKAIAWMVHQ